jgi:hypothetical protein
MDHVLGQLNLAHSLALHSIQHYLPNYLRCHSSEYLRKTLHILLLPSTNRRSHPLWTDLTSNTTQQSTIQEQENKKSESNKKPSEQHSNTNVTALMASSRTRTRPRNVLQDIINKTAQARPCKPIGSKMWKHPQLRIIRVFSTETPKRPPNIIRHTHMHPRHYKRDFKLVIHCVLTQFHP